MCFGGRRHFGVQARVLPVGELVLWYGMFAPCRRFLGTTGFACGAPLEAYEGDTEEVDSCLFSLIISRKI